VQYQWSGDIECMNWTDLGVWRWRNFDIQEI